MNINAKFFAVFSLFFLLIAAYSFSQGTAINTSGAAADNSALLDVSSTAKGVLVPRMTSAQKAAISSPANGLLIYQTDGLTGFWYFNGTLWVQAIGPAGATGATGVTGPAGGASQSCPTGFTSVNGQYCIEVDEHSAATWYAANTTCVSAGARLCSWGEWYSACALTAGLNNMTNNWEWMDDASAYDDNFAEVMGGAGNCTTTNDLNVGSAAAFRCCYSRGSGPAGPTGPSGASGQPASKRAFVTSTNYTGNLGGLAGADNICNTRASAAGLGGSWMAWLSTSTVDAKSRSTYAENYVTTNGDLISNNGWKGLVGSIMSEIRWDEFGAYVPNSSPTIFVWTGTELDGTDYGLNCSDWTSSSSSVDGGIGLLVRSDSQWSEYSQTACSSNQRRIYCFEQ